MIDYLKWLKWKISKISKPKSLNKKNMIEFLGIFICCLGVVIPIICLCVGFYFRFSEDDINILYSDIGFIIVGLSILAWVIFITYSEYSDDYNWKIKKKKDKGEWRQNV